MIGLILIGLTSLLLFQSITPDQDREHGVVQVLCSLIEEGHLGPDNLGELISSLGIKDIDYLVREQNDNATTSRIYLREQGSLDFPTCEFEYNSTTLEIIEIGYGID